MFSQVSIINIIGFLLNQFHTSQADLEPAVQLRMALNPWSFCLFFPGEISVELQVCTAIDISQELFTILRMLKECFKIILYLPLFVSLLSEVMGSGGFLLYLPNKRRSLDPLMTAISIHVTLKKQNLLQIFLSLKQPYFEMLVIQASVRCVSRSKAE